MPSLPDDWRSGVEQGDGFLHRVYQRKAADTGCLRVFIEGDGKPWISRNRVSQDPTPNDPVLLDIALQVPGRVLYLGRPCYFGLADSPGCATEDWTFARYSDAVVKSMRTLLVRHAGTSPVVMVGHSGGGTLAVLMAQHLPQTRGVVTLAAPLDLATWTRQHAYTPLFMSLDPLKQPPLPAKVQQLLVFGGRDENVPLQLDQHYLEKNPAARVLLIEAMTHTLDDVPKAKWARRIDRWLTAMGCPPT